MSAQETCAMQKERPDDGPGKLSGSMHLHVGGGHDELTVRDCFDAAHALPGYDGPCQYLHGHAWEVEVSHRRAAPRRCGHALRLQGCQARPARRAGELRPPLPERRAALRRDQPHGRAPGPRGVLRAGEDAPGADSRSWRWPSGKARRRRWSTARKEPSRNTSSNFPSLQRKKSPRLRAFACRAGDEPVRRARPRRPSCSSCTRWPCGRGLPCP